MKEKIKTTEKGTAAKIGEFLIGIISFKFALLTTLFRYEPKGVLSPSVTRFEFEFGGERRGTNKQKIYKGALMAPSATEVENEKRERQRKLDLNLLLK